DGRRWSEVRLWCATRDTSNSKRSTADPASVYVNARSWPRYLWWGWSVIESGRIEICERIVIYVRVAVVVLRIVRIADARVGREEGARDRILHPPVHVIEAHLAQRRLPGESLARNPVHDSLFGGAGHAGPGARLPPITVSCEALVCGDGAGRIQQRGDTTFLIL